MFVHCQSLIRWQEQLFLCSTVADNARRKTIVAEDPELC